jgi:hypothetical protein
VSDRLGVFIRQQFSIQELVGSDVSKLDGWALSEAYDIAISEIASVLPEDLKPEFERNFALIKTKPRDHRDFFDAELANNEYRQTASAKLLKLLGWIKGQIEVERSVQR